MLNRKPYYFTWHISCLWNRRGIKRPFFERNAFRDGGSLEWRVGPVVVEKRIHWRH